MRRPRATALGLGLAVLAALPAAGCDKSEVVSPTMTLDAGGGSVDVQCLGRTRIQIVGSQPAAGYSAETIVAGPSHQASLRFSSPSANDFKVFVHCADAQPFLEQVEIEDTTLTD